MIRVLKASWITALFLLGSASAASAQELGAILDWINKLSGPQFVGVGASFSTPLHGRENGDRPIRYRLDGILHFSYDEAEEVDPDDASIRMITLRNMVQFPVRYLPLDFAVGLSLHRFSGTDFDAFWHWSVPIQAQVRATLWPGATLRFGPSVDLFPAFDDEDFLPLVVDVDRDDGEPGLGLFVGVDLAL